MYVRIVIYGRYFVFLFLVIELINWLLILKLYSFMFFLRFSRMLDGFIFVKIKRNYNFC